MTEPQAPPKIADPGPSHPVPYRTELVISAGGAATSALTVGLLLWVYRAFEFDFSSFSFWLVIPVGALFSGAAAASGYYFAARWTDTMPSKRLLADALVIAVGAWGTLQWLKYTGMTFEDGSRVRDSVDFWTWFRVTTEHMSLSITSQGGSGFDTGQLGAWGYAQRVFEFAGFAAGGVFVYAQLNDAPACAPCRRYMKTQQLVEPLEADAFNAMMNRSGLQFPDLVDNVAIALRGRSFRSLGLELHSCPGCQATRVEPLLWAGKDDLPTRLRGYRVDSEQVSSLRTAAGG